MHKGNVQTHSSDFVETDCHVRFFFYYYYFSVGQIKKGSLHIHTILASHHEAVT